MSRPAAADGHSGAMVALFPDAHTAAQLADGATEKQRDIHLTLAFLGNAADITEPERLRKVIRGFAASTPPIAGEVSGTGYFTAAATNVAYASADLPDLPHTRERLADALRRAGFPPASDHGFTPHLTLGYGHEDVAAIVAPPGLPLRFETITLALGDRRYTYKLEGETHMTEADVDRDARVKRILPSLEEGEFRGELHPRDRMGRFREMVGGLQVGGHVHLPGARVERKGSAEFLVHGDRGQAQRVESARSAANIAAAYSAESTHPDSLGGSKKYASTHAALQAPQPATPSRAEQAHMLTKAEARDAAERRDLMSRTTPAEREAVKKNVSDFGGSVGDHTAARVALAQKKGPDAVDVRYSPDGKRMSARHPFGGNVVAWESPTGWRVAVEHPGQSAGGWSPAPDKAAAEKAVRAMAAPKR